MHSFSHLFLARLDEVQEELLYYPRHRHRRRRRRRRWRWRRRWCWRRRRRRC